MDEAPEDDSKADHSVRLCEKQSASININPAQFYAYMKRDIRAKSKTGKDFGIAMRDTGGVIPCLRALSRAMSASRTRYKFTHAFADLAIDPSMKRSSSMLPTTAPAEAATLAVPSSPAGANQTDVDLLSQPLDKTRDPIIRKAVFNAVLQFQRGIHWKPLRRTALDPLREYAGVLLTPDCSSVSFTDPQTGKYLVFDFDSAEMRYIYCLRSLKKPDQKKERIAAYTQADEAYRAARKQKRGIEDGRDDLALATLREDRSGKFPRAKCSRRS